MDARIASFFYGIGIAFNVADSTSFFSIIDENIKFAKQDPLQSYKTPTRKKLSGELLDQEHANKKLSGELLDQELASASTEATCAGLGLAGMMVAARLISAHGFAAGSAVAWLRMASPEAVDAAHRGALVVLEGRIRSTH